MNKYLRWGWRCGWGSACALLLAACATNGTESAGARADTNRRAAVALQSRREAALQPTWRGQPYEALHDARGPPTMMLKVPSGRPTATLVAVYVKAGDVAGCVDSFTLFMAPNTGKWTIADFFCR